jgi:hypothetical protein
MHEETRDFTSAHNDFLLLLTHIPKCAGTSFRHSVVHPNVDEELVYHPSGGWRELIRSDRDFRYLVGHFEVDIERLIRGPAKKRPKVFVTFLRNPVDQMISYYAFKRQLREKERIRRPRPAEIIRFYSANPGACNMQTRFCSGFWFSRLALRLPRLRPGQLELRKAKANLMKKFHFVGRFETLDEDMQRLCELLDFTYVHVHAAETQTRSRPGVNELTPHEVEELEAINHLDVGLYRFAEAALWKSAATCNVA